jgi:hypothetical protein
MAVRSKFSVWCVIVLASACSNLNQPKPPPFTVGGGKGSEFGNYAAASVGEITLDGERCRVWNWDRPLSSNEVLRYRSASCPSKEFPGRFVARGLGATMVPLADSALRFEILETAQGKFGSVSDFSLLGK